MAIEWITIINRLNKIPGFSATAEHVALFKDLYEQVQKECELLRSEYNRLKAENETLRQKLTALERTPDFEEIDGVLWTRKTTGGFGSKPRCPNCSDHPVMGEFPPGAQLHWVCSRCNGVFDYVCPP